MSTQKPSPSSSHSPSDADKGEEDKPANGADMAASSNRSDTQEDALTSHWKDIQTQVRSSEKTPGRVVPRFLAHLRTGLLLPGAHEARNIPTDIVPVEMWIEILSYLTEPNDLISCFRTCNLFHTELMKRMPKELFGAALPYLAKYLNQKEILKCRFVCPQWDKGVCRLHESTMQRNLAVRPPQNEPVANDLAVGNYLHQLTINAQDTTCQVYVSDKSYNFSIPITISNRSPNTHGNQTDMLLHPRNPFVGGVVRVPNTPVVEPSFPYEMDEFVSHLGTYLTSLTLDKIDASKLDELQKLCSSIVCIFKSCPKLKWFILGCPMRHPKKQKFDSAALELNALPDHSHIRYIDIGHQEYETISSWLFPKYSNQLYRLYVNEWNLQFFSDLRWENLTRIMLFANLNEHITAALRSLEAPQLRHLYIWFNQPENRTTLANILEAVYSFPRLTTLHMQFEKGAGIAPDPEEILGASAELICRSNVTSLEVVVPEGIIPFDFLVCFPFIRNLVLHVSFASYRRAKREAKKAKEVDSKRRSFELFHRVNHLIADANDDPTPGSSTSNDGHATAEGEIELANLIGRIVHLNQYLSKLLFSEDRAERNVCMYESNIWEILSYLQTLTVTEGFGDFRVDPKYVFTRNGYQNRNRK